MSDRDQRKKELEKTKDEMRKKLEEYKRKNEARTGISSSFTTTSPTTTSTTNNTSPTPAEDFNSIMSSIDQMVPTPSQKSQDNQSSQQDKSQQQQHQQQSLYRPTLTIQSLVIEHDIPPKEIPMYSKGTQTSDLDSNNINNLPNTPELEHQSNKQLNKSKYQLLQQEQLNKEMSNLSISKGEGGNDDGTNNNNNTDNANDENKEPEIIIPELDDNEKQKILESDSFKSFFDRTSRVIERALCLDESIDILADYTIADQNSKGLSKELKLLATLQDERWTKHRSVTDINWSTKHPELAVTSYSANEAGSHDPDGVVLVWSINNYFQKPEYVFNCQSPVMTTFFSKYHSTLIVGGTYSGQIVIWDTRAKNTPVQKTPLSSVGHTHPVYSMAVVGSANANSLVSISTDAKICSWSLENLSAPTETIELNSQSGNKSSIGGVASGGSGASGTSQSGSGSSQIAVTSLVFPENEMSQFYIGTEEGVICQASRHGNKIVMNERYKGHFGPITSVDLHSAKGSIDFSQYFLSSSTDWTVKLWSSKKETPLYSFEDYVDYVYDARWSPVHPSIFSTGDGSGHLSLWDLNQDLEAPILRHKISNRSVNRVCWSNDGKRILVGDSGGSLSLFDSNEFSQPSSDDYNKFEDVINKMVSKSSSDSPLLSSNHDNVDQE